MISLTQECPKLDMSNKETPLLILDSKTLVQNEVNKQELSNWLHLLDLRKILVHITDVDNFQEAHDYIFQYILNDQYSDKEDLNINLIDHDDLMDSNHRFNISSVFFLSQDDSNDLFEFLLRYSFQCRLPFFYLNRHMFFIESYIESVSINRDPLNQKIQMFTNVPTRVLIYI